jgi:hypothetical protein
MRVAVFTDNDFDKMNGVATTLRYAPADVRPRVYTFSELEVDEPEYLALHATGFPIPYYREMRMYLPRIGELARRLVADNVRLIHLTTPGLIQDSDRRRRMGEAARQYACGRTWTVALEPLFSLYRVAANTEL